MSDDRRLVPLMRKWVRICPASDRNCLGDLHGGAQGRFLCQVPHVPEGEPDRCCSAKAAFPGTDQRVRKTGAMVTLPASGCPARLNLSRPRCRDRPGLIRYQIARDRMVTMPSASRMNGTSTPCAFMRSDDDGRHQAFRALIARTGTSSLVACARGHCLRPVGQYGCLIASGLGCGRRILFRPWPRGDSVPSCVWQGGSQRPAERNPERKWPTVALEGESGTEGAAGLLQRA